jgi:hypothetical protein
MCLSHSVAWVTIIIVKESTLERKERDVQTTKELSDLSHTYIRDECDVVPVSNCINLSNTSSSILVYIIFLHMDDEELELLQDRIVKQVEFYLSPSNLHKDKFLQQRFKAGSGWVGVEVIASFKR